MSQTSHPAFVIYPANAAFGRTLPKNKIYERSGANMRVKELFVKQVDQIIWQYKLAPETINLAARPGVPEIQVFTLQLKTPELHQDVLHCIDGAVQFPIIFELAFDGRTQVVSCHKRPNEADASRWVLSDYFATDWLPVGSPRAAMPLAVDLASLYEQLLHRLIPLSPRPQERLTELVARVEQARAKRREVEKTAARLEREKQFNRKVEINATLRKLKTELEQLNR
ncbi:DUF4391 domain-containing protein [Cupriavidus sp. IK-TO18]|uniref:DUF4391 domain-containing protein n=1 Tax=Cupriavidus sp. IK-TO18 TaxID=2782182 RepID=UPI0018982DE6|nr:DUF4391 domain-containing protein [Cupriavidus sp. IK-TO18]MBF6986739.1 DUF4391 domain-containing protein [Cupriavidus sp. IK-TO18]